MVVSEILNFFLICIWRFLQCKVRGKKKRGYMEGSNWFTLSSLFISDYFFTIIYPGIAPTCGSQA